jgi:hypothetical protein
MHLRLMAWIHLDNRHNEINGRSNLYCFTSACAILNALRWFPLLAEKYPKQVFSL